MKSGDHSVDVIIVGAGVGGLAVAKTYLELSPATNLLLLEKRPTLGGVWAEENCYEGLKTNNLHGTYEFTDFPMDTKYKVLAMEKLDRGWKVTTMNEKAQSVIYDCDKLIIGTGLASNPNPVRIRGQEDFGKPVFNHSRLQDLGYQVAYDPDVTFVTVVGASKTGYDAVHLMASHGKKVNWVIRESGGGGVWMAHPWVKMGKLGDFRLEYLATMRFFSWFSPCVWGDADGFSYIRSALHKTRLGRYIVHKFWESMRNDIIETNGYRKESVLEHLEPQESLFWSARVGILNYPSDIHEYLRTDQVKIIKQDIDHLSSLGNVHFANGTTIQTDALIAIIGWNLAPSIKYQPDGLDAELGVPSLLSSETAKQQSLWNGLNKIADETILRQFPYLACPPEMKIPYKQLLSPFRLFRGVAPPNLASQSDYSLAYIKMVHSTSNMIIAEVQALWIYAFLNGKLDLDNKDIYHQTALLSRFGKHRYPCGFSAWYPEFVYDAIPYADMLLRDLGVRNWRKTSWFKEMFEGYTIHDYKGITREWMAKEDKKAKKAA